MLTRLKVNGFKNLVDVDIRLGPFTCIAGPNAVGKSNLFDAIRFLSTLASKTLMEAALSVRNETARNADVRSLFHRVAGTPTNHMSFEVEMIAPKEAVDDLGQRAVATANFLRYTLELRYRDGPDRNQPLRGPIEIEKEELVHIPSGQASSNLVFPHSSKDWRATALGIKHRSAPFISTVEEGGTRIIKLHQDGGGRGRAKSNPATQPRTVLSVANAAESPTVLCARREMESWALLQLEPAALREPDPVNAPFHLAANGGHLASTLYHLARAALPGSPDTQVADLENTVYAQTANRLGELIDDVAAIAVDRDDKREILTLQVTGKDGTTYPARSLSDGTLRFLALTILEMDPHARGLLCLEEPENGIHPARITAMLTLLQDIATDPREPIDDTNPLRQVIVNTHSPAVVLGVPDDALLVVEAREATNQRNEVFKRAVFSHLPDTWRQRADPDARPVSKGRLLAYLNPVSVDEEYRDGAYARVGRQTFHGGLQSRRRVVDRDDLQPYLPHVAE